MAYQCDYCEKGVDHGHNVSHAKNRTKRLRKPNLQSTRVVEEGEVIKRLLCTDCIKKANKEGRRPNSDKLRVKKQ